VYYQLILEKRCKILVYLILGDRSSDHLLKVDLDLINNRQCNKLYEAESKTRTLNRGIIDSMLCAGDLAGGHDTCLVSEIIYYIFISK